MVLDHLLLQQSCRISWNGLVQVFEQSLMEFYIILIEEHLEVASEMLEVGICSSLSLQN
jgi:hypothetical protein